MGILSRGDFLLETFKIIFLIILSGGLFIALYCAAIQYGLVEGYRTHTEYTLIFIFCLLFTTIAQLKWPQNKNKFKWECYSERRNPKVSWGGSIPRLLQMFYIWCWFTQVAYLSLLWSSKWASRTERTFPTSLARYLYPFAPSLY